MPSAAVLVSPAEPLAPRGLPATSGRYRPRPVTIHAVDDTTALVTRCQTGDARAFRELFRLHRDAVARLVQRMTGPSADLPDLVQEVFLQVHRSLGDFRGEARFSTWLYRLTGNVLLMHRRAAKSRPTLVDEADSGAPTDPVLFPGEQVARRMRVPRHCALPGHASDKRPTSIVA